MSKGKFKARRQESSAKHRLVTFQWSGMARRGFLKRGIIEILELDNC